MHTQRRRVGHGERKFVYCCRKKGWKTVYAGAHAHNAINAHIKTIKWEYTACSAPRSLCGLPVKLLFISFRLIYTHFIWQIVKECLSTTSTRRARDKQIMKTKREKLKRTVSERVSALSKLLAVKPPTVENCMRVPVSWKQK